MRKGNKKRIALGTFFALLIIPLFAAGCSDDSKLIYETNCNQKELDGLKGKSLALLVFEHSGTLLQSAEILSPTAAQAVSDGHKADFKAKVQPLFTITDLSEDNALWKSQTPGIADPDLIREILEEKNLEGGILVTNTYGYQMSGSVLEKALENIFPKDWVGVTFGPSSVEFYYFASNTYIVNKEGSVIWNFYGKASMIPVPLTGSAADEADSFVRGVIGLDPSDQELAKVSIAIASHYTDFLVWLMQTDLDKSIKKNYITDYPGMTANRNILVYPASETAHVPFTSTIAP